MKTVTFTASNQTENLTGTIILRENKTDIFFEGDFDLSIHGFVDAELNQTNIKNVSNFIASYIKRIDKKSLFSSIFINKKETKILKNEPEVKTMAISFIGDITDQVFFQPQKITIKGLDSKSIEVETNILFPSNTRIVPLDFKYSKNEQLNKILAFNLIEHDYPRKINKLLLAAIKNINYKMKIKSHTKYFYMTAQGALTENKDTKHILVIPRELW